jgi:hypothetical protein
LPTAVSVGTSSGFRIESELTWVESDVWVESVVVVVVSCVGVVEHDTKNNAITASANKFFIIILFFISFIY